MKILIVDDDPMAGEMIQAVLEGLGHETRMAEDGMAAIAALEASADVELILSDMNMPMISGIDLFQTLREQGVQLPFILLTGDDPAELMAREPGLDACVLKDFALEETLAQAIAQVMARRAEA